MRSLCQYCLATGLVCFGSLAAAEPASTSAPTEIAGYWRNIDDVTGFSKGIVQIQPASNGTYFGRIVEIIPRPNYTPMELCNNCPEPFTDQKILGLTAVWNLKASANKDRGYTGGYIIDPLNGKIYAAELRVSADGRRLTVRGNVIGARMLKRSQIWIREPHYTPKYTFKNSQ